MTLFGTYAPHVKPQAGKFLRVYVEARGEINVMVKRNLEAGSKIMGLSLRGEPVIAYRR